MTRAATLEKIAEEYKSAAPRRPRHREIPLSGDRAGFRTRSWAADEREVSNQLLNRPVEANYSELVLQAYQRLQKLHDQQPRHDSEISRCKLRIEELQALEAAQVQRLLNSRLALPLGEETRLKQTTDSLLSKYGHLIGEE